MLDRVAADILQRRQRIADGALARDEADLRAVDRRRLDAQAEPPRLLREAVQLVGVAHVERHRGGEELDRVVRLEIGGLIGDQRVGGGMRLVEAVAREFRHQLEDIVGAAAVDAVRDGALDEALLLRRPSPP